MGGQLLAPHTKAKCMYGSCFSRATFKRGSDFPNGLNSIPVVRKKSLVNKHLCDIYYNCLLISFQVGNPFIQVIL